MAAKRKGTPKPLNHLPIPDGVRESLIQLGARIILGAVTELQALDLFEVVARHTVDAQETT